MLLLLLPRSICNILVACHVVEGNAAKAESPISPTHSLTHSFSRLFRHSCNFHSYKQPSTQPWMHCQRGRGRKAVWGVSGNMFVRMWKINEKIVNKSAKAEIKHGSLTHKHRHTHRQGHAFGCLHRLRQAGRHSPEAAQTEAHSSLAGAVSAFFCTIYVF